MSQEKKESVPATAAVAAASPEPGSLIDNLAYDVAYDVMPEEKDKQGEKSSGFLAILEVVMTIINTLVQNCPKTPEEAAAGIINPSVRQRAALLKTAKDVCDCCGLKSKTGDIAKAMRFRGSRLNKADALALVSQASDDVNLLI